MPRRQDVELGLEPVGIAGREHRRLGQAGKPGELAGRLAGQSVGERTEPGGQADVGRVRSPGEPGLGHRRSAGVLGQAGKPGRGHRRSGGELERTGEPAAGPVGRPVAGSVGLGLRRWAGVRGLLGQLKANVGIR